MNRNSPWYLVLILSSFFPFVAALLYFIIFSGTPTVRWLFFLSKILQFTFPFVVWILRGENIKSEFQSIFSSPKSLRFKNAKMALATSLAILTIGVPSYFGIFRSFVKNTGIKAEIYLKLIDFNGATPLNFFFLSLFISILHSFLEEFYWRGFVFSEFAKVFDKKISIILSSLAFALHHIVIVYKYAEIAPKAPYVLLGSAVVLGCGFCWSIQYANRKSLTSCWASHIVADLFMLGIGYDIVFIG